MPDIQLALGEWLPDLAPYGHNGLTIARNVYAAPIGYKPIRDVSSVTTALPHEWRGGGSFIDVDSTTVTVAGTDAGLYTYTFGSWSLSYSGTYSSRWSFAQWGGLVLGVNGGAPVKYTITTATGAALGGSPPNASMIAIVRDFVFLAGNSAANSTVYWSSINNAEGWTIGTSECDIQQLPDGGAITALTGGEYGLAFQDAAIHRFTYVGSPLIFQHDKIVDGIGCIANGAAATFGRTTFFLSSRGFYAISDGGLEPIGDGKVNETFWKLYSRSDVTSTIRCTIDPKRALVIWSMRDRLWIYNWTLQRWSDVVIPGLIGLSTGVNASISLEEVDVLFPGGLDSVPYSLDDPIFIGGDPLLTIVKTDNTVYSFASAGAMAATLMWAVQEPFRGRNTRVRRGRVGTDAISGVTLSIGHAGRLGDTFDTVSSSNLTGTGYLPIRVTEQFLQPSIDIAAGTSWSYVSGLDLDAAPGGSF